MISKNNFNKRTRCASSLNSSLLKTYSFLLLMLTIGFINLEAQDTIVKKYTKPSWWFGAAAGANINFYDGSTYKLNSDFTPPATFHKGMGVGLYLAPLIEYHRPESRWGFMLQAGYDSRRGSFNEIKTPCNCPADLSTDLSYISVEPSLRFAPFKSDFYLYAGPRLAYNYTKSFTYHQKVNPDFPSQVIIPDVNGDFSEINKMLISFQIGAGYDIYLSSQKKHTQFVLSPFISFQPYFGQTPRSIETWNNTTLRVGVALKLGRGKLNKIPAEIAAIDPQIRFLVFSPRNIPIERRVRETFPLRNYVFFDLGSNEIPDRYVLLTKDQVKDFKEDQLEVFTPKRLSGRSSREMTAYYNILNILGDRMQKNPSATIRLTGASMEGSDDGIEMAESVKKYLVTVFNIDTSKIRTEGRIKPRIPSEQLGGTKEIELLREGDRRVSIWSETPALLMEFQSGPKGSLKPVEIVSVQVAPLDSYIKFTVEEGIDALESWSIEVKDKKGFVQKFGPYTQEFVSIPGKTILGDVPEGNYIVSMIGKTPNGRLIKKDTTVNMVLWTPPKNEEGMRYSVLFEFNASESIEMYDKYLTEIVTPKIPNGGTVIIHGYTDIIGEENHNRILSLARAKDVKAILVKSLSAAGRSDVTFEVYGFGEDLKLSPFENNSPEERFYNRTVIIDIIPHK